MAITCTWSVNDMTHVDADGGVVLVHWSCRALSSTNKKCKAVKAGKTHCEYDASSPTYIQYADLTQDDVLNWVYASIVERNDDGVMETPTEAKARVETELRAKVQALETRMSSQSNGVPWSIYPDQVGPTE